MFLAKTNKEDLTFLRELLEAGKLALGDRPDATTGWRRCRDALAYLGEGHARGKVVVTLGRD